jgi:hypothetical protein
MKNEPEDGQGAQPQFGHLGLISCAPLDLHGGTGERSELDGTMGCRASKSAAARAVGPWADPESPSRPRVPDQREP